MFIKPSYEDYKKATNFARFKYKYGFTVSVMALICLVILIFSIWYYGEEIASHPLVYAANSLDMVCQCVGNGQVITTNGADITLGELNFGGFNSEFYRGVDSAEEGIVFNGS